MKQIIDIETWERRITTTFSATLLAPGIPLLQRLIVQRQVWLPEQRDALFSFTIFMPCSVRQTRWMNFVSVKDKNGQVVFHDRVDIISPIAVPGKTFYTIRIPYHEDFNRFYAEAYALITNIPEDGDPYGAEKHLAQQGDYDVVHLSAVPKMYFTSTTYTLAEAGNACSHPLMTAGKTVTREGRLVFPLSIYVDHSFVDGSHLASFFGKIEEYLKEISHE